MKKVYYFPQLSRFNVSNRVIGFIKFEDFEKTDPETKFKFINLYIYIQFHKIFEYESDRSIL